jgi:hypothetical protein
VASQSGGGRGSFGFNDKEIVGGELKERKSKQREKKKKQRQSKKKAKPKTAFPSEASSASVCL